MIRKVRVNELVVPGVSFSRVYVSNNVHIASQPVALALLTSPRTHFSISRGHNDDSENKDEAIIWHANICLLVTHYYSFQTFTLSDKKQCASSPTANNTDEARVYAACPHISKDLRDLWHERYDPPRADYLLKASSHHLLATQGPSCQETPRCPLPHRDPSYSQS